ncbi:MAG TPA: hypothetical protein VIL79_01535, partial [Thermoleophilia bacterium]
AEAENNMEFGDDEGVDGQCMAVMRTGKRCPNQAEPDSRYCSIHSDYVAPEPVAKAAAAGEAAAPAEGDTPDAPAAEAGEE